ncbi:multidrug ABC transporter ATP-binding protein [Methanobrevibacter sp. YE315]|uniref:ABC transporter ATP-binding protein n=1 Tax=Methanobrevibacter sp. YE315 TaxID=1609968 RepID=UPI000764EB5E|nr:ABC transporter ATP-binding protein [Methanobrevibacter sp. YE315]AMD17605.1 multidrug ABC transporter ATP-binding protein [Methanobrevibacter sp. YE315]
MARKPRRAPPEKPANTKQSIKNIFSLLVGYKLKLTLTVICGIISTVFSVIGPLLIGFATTAIFDGIRSGNMNMEYIINLLITVVILYVVSAVFSYLQSYLLLDITTDISYNLRKDLIEKVTHLSMGDLDKNTRGDILSRITNDVDSLQSGIVQTFNQLLTGVVTIVGVTAMMLSINVWLTLATIVLVPISFFIIFKVTKFSQDYYLKQLEYRGRLNGQIEESFTGHEIIRSFNQEEESMNIFDEENENWYEQEWKSKFFSSLSGPLVHFISNLQYVIISVLGAVFVLQNAISVGDILAFIQYSKNFTTPIEQITRIMNMIQTAMAASERIFAFLEIDVEKNPYEEQIKEINEEISFENVNFGYSEDELVIKDLSFKVKKGEKIAIVGETGAGKTTIVKLLMRFYDVNSGEIKIDGVNINRYDKHSIRSLVGMVLQDTWLFNDTIFNNIRYGKLDATDEEVIAASKEAHADHFIMQNPEGYEMMLNEDADNISHGQKQLLTIARTILSNKQILILDEATSSVDTRTEKLIQKAMDSLMENRTSFIIAHRLSTVRDADKIIVIDDGHIIEHGTHEELLEQKGYYYNTLNSQNRMISFEE